jgi:hypothetical protein
LEKFEDHMSRGEYRQALDPLESGLRQTLAALASMGFSPPSIPFLESRAGAVVALFNRTSIFDLMDDVAREISSDRVNDVEHYRRHALLMEAVRNEMSAPTELRVSDVRRQHPDEDARDITRLLKWMEKNDELTLIKEGRDFTLRPGMPAVRANIVQRTYRANRYPVTPQVGPHRLAGYATRMQLEPFEADSPIDELPLPKPQRLGRTHASHITRDGTWLIPQSRTMSGGHSSTTATYAPRTGPVKAFDLPFKVMRAFSGYDRELIILLDEQLVVHTFTDGEKEIDAFSLADSPEFSTVRRGTASDTKSSAMIRAVDVSERNGDFVYSAIDTFWRFDENENLVFAEQYHPGAAPNEPGTVARIPGKELAQPMPLPVSQGGEDWIYFAKFSSFDDSLYVGFYSGQVNKLDPQGRVLSSWVLHGPPTSLVEDIDGAVVSDMDSTYRLVDGEPAVDLRVPGNGFITPTHAVGVATGPLVVVTNLGSGSTRCFPTTSPIEAIYPANGRARISMRTKYADLPLH